MPSLFISAVCYSFQKRSNNFRMSLAAMQASCGLSQMPSMLPRAPCLGSFALQHDLEDVAYLLF